MKIPVGAVAKRACLASLTGFAATIGAHAYTYKVIYNFCSQRGCTDGAFPGEGITLDLAGNIYGTTLGNSGDGTVYELTPATKRSGWKFKKLYGGKNLYLYYGRFIFDVSGNIYGAGGGGSKGYGTIFELLPNGERTRRVWKELYSFAYHDPHGTFPTGITYQGASSGAPYDGVSPLFGTTSSGGSADWGVAFSLSPNGDSWEEGILYNFCSLRNCKDGGDPSGSLIVDGSGNLFGNAAYNGGKGYHGVVFELQNHSGSWSEMPLYNFCSSLQCSDGALPTQNLLQDAAGNLFGVTYSGGVRKKCCGVLFQLTPQGAESTYSVLTSFCEKRNCVDGAQPSSDPVMDASGNLFGTTQTGGRYRTDPRNLGGGTVFKWDGSALEILYSFCKLRDCADGEYPRALAMDASGDLFGTTTSGGKYGAGTIFELSP
jgi:uncharacterized repeat protein (TIGR03803 family)